MTAKQIEAEQKRLEEMAAELTRQAEALAAASTPATAPAAPPMATTEFAPRMDNSGAVNHNARRSVDRWEGLCSGHGKTQEERDESDKHRIVFDKRGFGIRPKSGKTEVFDWEKGCNERAAYQTFIRRKN
jgi:hypothetical protein